jgi:hypothetical protein
VTSLRIVLSPSRAELGARLTRNAKANAGVVLDAMRATANQVSQRIEQRGRDDIQSAGNFGSRWTDGWKAEITEGGGFVRVTVSMAVPYWRVFQDGMVIYGKPMLWIPLSFASDAVGIRAGEYPGSLFRVNRAGKAPLLMTRQGKGPAEAKYFGKESVTEPKKFHLVEIIKEVSSEMPGLYRDNFRRLKSNG